MAIATLKVETRSNAVESETSHIPNSYPQLRITLFCPYLHALRVVRVMFDTERRQTHFVPLTEALDAAPHNRKHAYPERTEGDLVP